ncbi:S41 family peptidase [Fulvivirga ulvae]|uniref:S41 family peptidase n=1 Tax=Fulvivirga ulvae TaxID=2904245 RepID=UPI001F2AB1D3|nr:S41 family peptidase [Fulvivirga ulvae]UII30030.1 S41 family peptidase [Fulvivirga ulvae]
MTLRNRKLKIWSAGTLIILVALSFSNPSDRYFEIAKNLDIFATLFKEVNALYVDEVNPNKVIKTGIDAMLASLDPYTNYIPEDDIEDFRTQSTGQYGGIGAITSRLNGKIKVVMLMEGYSAEKNGLRIGDEVIKINDIDVRELSREETSDLMKGQANTPVSLTVLRYGSTAPITLDFKREKVKISNVPYYGMVSTDIGYVKLTEFTMQAGKEVRNAVDELKDKGAKKIILDVRGNPGGLLIEAVNITNVFLPKGQEVVSTKGKLTENNASYKTLNNPVDEEIPLVVLINSGSASASEIVAGTIQDYDRGVIIGQKSFGKGLVQITRPLSYNSQLKVTTAKYYTPSGRCIQALDYSFRNEDGSVGAVPDSIKMEFKTTNGRTVMDGGGIDPDITIEKESLSPIAQSLFIKGYIFDYATKYHFDHQSITEAKNFKLSEQEYQAFTDWLSDKDYSYTTQVEKKLEELTKNAKKEKYYEDIKERLSDVKTTLENSKKNDLTDFKSQIVTMLEDEITSRYYLEKGSVESTFDSDEDILAAIKVLNQPERYKQILGKQ